MIKLYLKQLHDRFTSAMRGVPDVVIEEGNPFVMKLAQQSFLIFIKSLSPAYFKGSPDISRVQLPVLKIPESSKGFPLIVLGYDADYDVYAGWNPERIRRRLNSRSNVSLYSRISVQERPANREFNEGVLTTGERFYVFHSSMLPDFFTSFTEIFAEDTKCIAFSPSIEGASEPPEILTEITDERVLRDIIPLLKETKILEAASACFSHYGSSYPKMSLPDWLEIAKRMYDKVLLSA